MGVVSRARNAQIIISLQDVLRAKSVVHLARLAKKSPSTAVIAARADEETEEPFALSPIQRVYLRLAAKHDGDGRFNQSFALEAPRGVTASDIRQSMDSIVQRHSMLRARFVKEEDGSWRQRTIKVRLLVYIRIAVVYILTIITY